jgi:hypothetical protein
MSLRFKAVAGVLSSALALAACSDPFEGQTCAISPDGALVATADEGKTYRHLNDYVGNQIADAASWVEGKSGWGDKPICATRDGEFIMPMKDFARGGVVAPHTAEEVQHGRETMQAIRALAPGASKP